MTTRLPRLALAAWAIAATIVVALVVAVVHYLTRDADAVSMHMSSADALTRAGGGTPTQPLADRLFTAWQLDAIAVAVLVIAAAGYLTGVAVVAARAGQRWPVRRTASFIAGLAVCAFATNGSIAVYDQVLFTAHMAGHLALVMLAPALLVAGHPLSLAVEAASAKRRERILRVARGRVISLLTSPPLALAAYAAVIVGSHLTGLMDTIMRNTWAGQLEHLVYLLVGCQFFVLVVGQEPIRWRLASPARWLLLAIAMAVDTFTGIVLMQGTVAVHLEPSSLGVDPLSETHSGGAIMWFFGDGIMAVVMVALVVNWLRVVDRSPAPRGWLEQARGAAFMAHTGAAGADVDEDDAARVAYNEWLQRLNRS